MNVLDIVIIAFVAFTIYRGYKVGAILSLFHLLSYIVALVVTYFYHVAFKLLLINNTPLDDNIANFISERLKQLGANSTTATVSTADLNALQSLPLPDNIKESITEFLTTTTTSATNNVVSAITDVILSAISIIVLFLVVLIIMKLLASLLNVVAKLPVLNTFNHILGIFFGIIKAYLIICITYLISIAFLALNTYPQVEALLNTSYLSNIFINYNLFLMWLQYIPQ